MYLSTCACLNHFCLGIIPVPSGSNFTAEAAVKQGSQWQRNSVAHGDNVCVQKSCDCSTVVDQRNGAVLYLFFNVVTLPVEQQQRRTRLMLAINSYSYIRGDYE